VGYILGDFFSNSSVTRMIFNRFLAKRYLTLEDLKLYFGLVPGLPNFSWCVIPKQEKMYQMSTICTERSQNIPNIHNVFLMAIKYINIFQSEALKIFSQIGIFGLKTNHLATLLGTAVVFYLGWVEYYKKFQSQRSGTVHALNER
jgi:hypothetical protein